MTTRPSNPGPDHPASDREALSALFDGELVGDAARFALKRLDHDHAWRSTCERWQQVGDVLRNRNAPLPVSFHARLRDAVHADARHASAHAAAATTRARREGLRWGSAALVASAAVVAVFLVGSPFGGRDEAGDRQMAETPVPAAKPQFASQAPLTPAIDLDTATAAVGVAAAAATQRSRSLQRDRAATDRIVSAALAAQAPVTADAGPMPGEAADTVETVSTEVAPSTSPFTGESASEAARPWPRAVLPQYRDRGGALAADYATAPSFYPFGSSAEPATPDDASRAAPTDSTTTPQSPPAPAP